MRVAAPGIEAGSTADTPAGDPDLAEAEADEAGCRERKKSATAGNIAAMATDNVAVLKKKSFTVPNSARAGKNRQLSKYFHNRIEFI